jgi:hypothetical protein
VQVEVAARLVLDELEVPRRLAHIRDYVWRGGQLEFRAEQRLAGYWLVARWPTAVFEPIGAGAPDGAQLVPARQATAVGRWVRGAAGYSLGVGLELGGASAGGIVVAAPRLRCLVPVARRPAAEIAAALERALDDYAQEFLAEHEPVPQARAAAAETLRQQGL